MNSTIKKIVVIIVCAAFGLAGAVAIASFATRLWHPNTGQIVIFETYIDGEFVANNTAVDWEVCEPGYIYSYQLKVVNSGELDLLATVVAEGLPEGWLLTWEHDNTVINAGTFLEGELALTIPATATSWPEWGFWIYGEETT